MEVVTEKPASSPSGPLLGLPHVAPCPYARLMDHVTYLTAIREESERFLDALAATPPDAAVPACADWTATDLLWHLAEVQHTWARVVQGGTSGDQLPEPERPADGDLAGFAALSGTELLAALDGRDPAEPCWSWHADGGSVGWVARRQAHEALIHRVDAEQAAGRQVTPPTPELAADGVDEVLRVMVDGLPAWATFAADGVHVRLVCTNADASWTMALGRFTGTSPSSGTVYDEETAALVADTPDADLTLAGPAWDLDRWLWGRGGIEAIDVSGDPAVLERLKAVMVDATQ